jgi:hypothetical protein
MGLINTSHSTMTQSVIDLQTDLIKNPFYLFNDKKGLPVDYYNINTSKTTLDPSLKIAYDDHGPQSPIRYNLIKNMYLYGIDRAALNLENTEFGVTSSELSGDGIILPDTITPYAGDSFVITMIKQRYIFNVNAVTMDTFDNGGNYWKIEYSLSHLSDAEFKPLIVDEYEFISGNVGTNYSPVLLKTKFNICKILDDAAVNLKGLFKGLYFNDKVQTYVFVYLYHVCKTNMNSDYFYDPYIIEFIIRNELLKDGSGMYNFIDHKTHLKPEFNIKYNHSIWKVLETNEKNELPSCKHSSSATYISDPATIFGTRYEDYFELTYNDPDPVAEMFAPAIDILDPQVIGHILEDQLFDQNTKYTKYNLLIKYFNHHEYGVEDIIPFERIIETENNMENYFLIPMAIFIIEKYIKDSMRISKSE